MPLVSISHRRIVVIGILEQTYFEVSVLSFVGAPGLKWTSTSDVVSFVLSSSNGVCLLSPHSHWPLYFFSVPR